MLGVQPMLGRTFGADEDQEGRYDVVVLGHDLWTRRFGANPAVVGRKIVLDGRPYEVVGAGDVLVQREVVARRPLLVDLGGAGGDLRTGPPPCPR